MRVPTMQQTIARTIQLEGGFQNINVQGDRGKQTYAGISRRWWPKWEGWDLIDRGQTPPQDMVYDFYHGSFWIPAGLEQVHISFPQLAAIAFDFAVMAGLGDARKLLAFVGCPTAEAVRGLSMPQKRLMIYMAEHYRISHHRADVEKNPKQVKFLAGWVNRANAYTKWIIGG